MSSDDDDLLLALAPVDDDELELFPLTPDDALNEGDAVRHGSILLVTGRASESLPGPLKRTAV